MLTLSGEINTGTDMLHYLYLYLHLYLYQVQSSSNVMNNTSMNIDTDKPLLVLVPVQLLSTSSGTNTGGNNTGNDFDPFDVPGSGGNDTSNVFDILDVPYAKIDEHHHASEVKSNNVVISDHCNDENFDAIFEETSIDNSSTDIGFLPKIFIPYYLVNGTAIYNLITATLLEMNPSMGSDSYDNSTVFAATAFQLLIMNGNDVKVITTVYSSKNGLIIRKGNNIWSDDAGMATFLRNHRKNNNNNLMVRSHQKAAGNVKYKL